MRPRDPCVRWSRRVPGILSALSTPRISLDGSQTTICACPRAPQAVVQPCMVEVEPSVGYPGWCGGGYTGWVLYRVLTQACSDTRLLEPYIVRQGPVRTPRHSRPLQGPPHTAPHPSSDTPIFLSISQYISVYILKLVINPECHLKLVMRPAIVPVSKKRS